MRNLNSDISIKGPRDANDPGTLIKRIIGKAFKAEGIKMIEDVHHCLLWGIGEDYPYEPYQNWGERIRQKHPEISPVLCLDATRWAEVPIKVVMQALARLYIRKMKVSPRGLKVHNVPLLDQGGRLVPSVKH